MFGLFRRKPKDKPELILEPPPCPHTFKDFPWYMTSSWNEKGKFELVLKLMEPYVCVHCGERKDIQLVTTTINNIKLNQVKDAEKEFLQEFGNGEVRPISVVEDMIHDAIFVDREKLSIVNKIRGI